MCSCETCYAGACVSDCLECEICDGDVCRRVCPVDEICCISGPPNDQTIDCAADCCGDEDCTGECGVCYDGQCIGCGPNEECCRGICVDEGECCREFGEECGLIVNGTSLAEGVPQLDCCDGLVCCENDFTNSIQVAMYCAECCNNWGCPKGWKCCHGECIPEERCCGDWDCDDCEICYQGQCRLTGVPFGETCGIVVVTEGGSEQLDCCDGLVCCDDEKKGAHCAECCGDFDRPKGAECHDGICQFKCDHDKDCTDGTCCCKSGHCSKHCCPDHPDEPDKPEEKPDTPVDTAINRCRR